MWDQSGKEERKLGYMHCFDFSSDGKYIAVGGHDEEIRPTIRVISLEDGSTVMTALVPGPGDLAFSPDGKMLVSFASFGRALDVWDVKTAQKVRTLRGHTGQINAVLFHPDGRLISCSWDKTIRFWDPNQDQEWTALEGVAFAHPSRADIHPTGREVAIVAGDRVAGDFSVPIYLWSPTGSSKLDTKHKFATNRIGYSRNGDRLIAGGQDGNVSVFDSDAKVRIGHFNHTGRIQAVAVSPDGKWAVSSHEPIEISNARMGRGEWKTLPGDARVWNVETGVERFLLGGHTSTVYAVAISPNGTTIATASYGQLRMWDASTGTLRFEIMRPEVGADDLLFNPAGTVVASAAKDGVRLLDVASGAKLAELPGYGDSFFKAFAFTSDGSRMATAYGPTVRLWDTASGQQILTLPLAGENLQVLALRFAPEGNRLLGVLNDGTIRAWGR